MKHRLDIGDINRIENAFHIATEAEVLLSQEFEMTSDDQSFVEGKSKLRIHLSKERNQYPVKQAKTEWLKNSSGNLHCSICNFSFQDTCGSYGQSFIEAHHIKPISSLSEKESVIIKDLVPVCSNCHRILHRTKPYLSIEELATIYIKNKK